MNFNNQRNKAGYSLEELYFEKVNRELIHKLKSQKTPSAPPSTGEEMGKVLQFKPRTGTDAQTVPMKKAA